MNILDKKPCKSSLKENNSFRQAAFKKRNEELGRKRYLSSIYLTESERDIIKPLISEKLDELRKKEET